MSLCALQSPGPLTRSLGQMFIHNPNVLAIQILNNDIVDMF